MRKMYQTEAYILNIETHIMNQHQRYTVELNAKQFCIGDDVSYI